MNEAAGLGVEVMMLRISRAVGREGYFSPAVRPLSIAPRPGSALAALLLLALLAGCGAGGKSTAPGQEDADLAFHRGVNALDEGRYEWARRHFADDLARHPERAAAWRYAGIAWSAGPQQSLSRVAECYSRYLELEDDGAIRLRLAQQLFLLGEVARSRELLATLPSRPAADLLRANLELGDGEIAAARRAVEAALAAAPDLAAVHATAALVYQRADEHAQALVHARRAVTLDPLDYKSHYLAARLARLAGDTKVAEEALQRHQLLTRLQGEGSLAPPTPAEALRLMRTLEAQLDDEAKVAKTWRWRLMELLVETGRRDEATPLVAALAADPAALTPTEALTLGAYAERLGDPDLAAQLYTSLTASDDGAARREARFRLARLAVAAGDSAAARSWLRTALVDHPHIARLHYLLAQIALQSGEEKEATAALEQAVSLAPWRDDYRIALADRLLAAGRDDDARALIAAAPEPAPTLEQYEKIHGFS